MVWLGRLQLHELGCGLGHLVGVLLHLGMLSGYLGLLSRVVTAGFSEGVGDVLQWEGFLVVHRVLLKVL